MAQQSNLEKNGLSKRKEQTQVRDHYNFNKTNPYSENHELAKTHNDKGHPWGKGTGEGGHTYTTPNWEKSKTAIDRSQFNTESGGGSHDIFGINDYGGRSFLQRINLYGPDREYGVESISSEENINDGQVVIGTNARNR